MALLHWNAIAEHFEVVFFLKLDKCTAAIRQKIAGRCNTSASLSGTNFVGSGNGNVESVHQCTQSLGIEEIMGTESKKRNSTLHELHTLEKIWGRLVWSCKEVC